MLIFPRPSIKCGMCKESKVMQCSCLCHEENITQSKHVSIRRDAEKIKVKPVKDLDYFRNV